MHVRDHRCRRAGPQGAAGDRRRLPGERPVLARSAARSQAPRIWRLRPSWPPATGRSVSRKPCARSTGRRASSAVGCRRPPTCSTSSRSPSIAMTRQAAPTRTSGWPRPARWPRRPSTSSSRPMAPSTTKRWPAWPRTATCCSPSTTSRHRALEAHSHHQSHRKHLCDRAPQDHQDQGLPQPHDGAHHGTSSCASRPARSGDIAWTARTRSPTSFKASNSRTEKS